jgi:hypothetical protein
MIMRLKCFTHSDFHVSGRIASRTGLTAVAALWLTAGCTSPTDSTGAQHNRTSTTVSAATSVAPRVAAVNLDDLLSAPVPKLCEHPPGDLVNGRLPVHDSHRGHVDVAKKLAPSDDYWVAFGDLTGDGVADGVLVTACSAGGVPWPATVQLYSAGPTRLGGVDLSDLTHGGSEIVTGLSIAGGMVHVSWITQGPNEPACCGTVQMAGDLRWDSAKVVAQNVQRTN